MIYNFDINGQETSILLKDITKNVRLRKELLSNITIYDEYDIVDDETPEHIAEKFYKNPNYHWIIMLTNDRYDYISDFPMNAVKFERFVTDKYGSGNEYDIHHYVNPEGYIVSSDVIGALSVSNYDYEVSVNESKRRIKIVPKQIIDKVLKDFNSLI